MACYHSLVFGDHNGGTWTLAADNSGRITLTAITIIPGNVPDIPVIDKFFMLDSTTTQTWALTLLPSGQFQITAVASLNITTPRWISAESPNGTVFRIVIAAGVLQTVQQPADLGVQVPTVGVIYNPDDASYRPPFTQPGGPGTATLPAEDPGQQLGLFVFGCGHWFNHLMVKRTTVNCQPAAILVCPVCDFCQRIIVPYDAIYGFSNEILIA